MPPRIFEDNNISAGIAPNSNFRVGRSNKDSPFPVLEKGISLPWASDPSASWVYYECSVWAFLDSGVVIHTPLPQVDNSYNGEYDTLSQCSIDDPQLDRIVLPGINLTCRDQYQDVIQRMGHARYWFRLWGQALRIGYQIPIPAIKKIGGVDAIPYDGNPQFAYNGIAPGANYSGAILWRAAWSLWYTTVTPPVNNVIHTADPSAHISSVVKPPLGMQAPYSPMDDSAVATDPRRPGAQSNRRIVIPGFDT